MGLPITSRQDFGNGAVFLDGNGLTVYATAAYADPNAYKFRDPADDTVIAYTSTVISAGVRTTLAVPGQAAGSDNYLILNPVSVHGKLATVQLTATSDGTATAQFSIQAKDTSSPSTQATLNTSLRVGDTTTPTITLDILGKAGIDLNGDLRTSRSAAATTPGSIIKKLALLDMAGTVLGYLPIYDAIT